MIPRLGKWIPAVGRRLIRLLASARSACRRCFPFRDLRVLNWRREVVLNTGLVVVVGMILARLVHLQVLCRTQFVSRASRQQISSEPVLARDGDLLDRHGHVLATTITTASVYVNPLKIRARLDLVDKLARAVGLSPQMIRSRIEEHARQQFLWVQRRLTDEQTAAVRALGISTDLAGLRCEMQRHYPQGSLAAHLLGIRNIDGTGQGGAEQAFDRWLKGVPGKRTSVRDARGYVLEILEQVTDPPVDGADVMLTIDVLMQLNVEQQLDKLIEKHHPHGACAIVLDPRNGEVLALASRPAFDPNDPGTAGDDAWKNMAVCAVFEPGSTFKPFVVAWGLDQELIAKDEIFDCGRGAYRMGRRILHDHHRYGKLSVTDVLVKSSNIGMAKIGQRLGNEQLYQLSKAFGFGEPTGIELPGELTGILRPLDDWTSYSTGSIPMGQELAATPLQVLAAHAILANGGERISPHLLLATSSGQRKARQVMVSRVVAPQVAQWVVREPLVEVVQRGTGKQAKLPGISVFGKTGTAQKSKSDGGGYSSSRHVSSFVCGAPAEAPQLLVLVSVDEPQGADQFGGTVAAPVASAILERGLQIWNANSTGNVASATTEQQPR